MNNYKEQLQQNNNELNTILQTVNSLPEAGGSSPTYETVNITLKWTTAQVISIYYNTFNENTGTIETIHITSPSASSSGVVCPCVVGCMWGTWATNTSAHSGDFDTFIENMISGSADGNNFLCTIRVPSDHESGLTLILN